MVSPTAAVNWSGSNLCCAFFEPMSVNQLRPSLLPSPYHGVYSSNSNDIIDCADGCHHRGKCKQNRVRLPRDCHHGGWLVTERDIRVEHGENKKKSQEGAMWPGLPKTCLSAVGFLHGMARHQFGSGDEKSNQKICSMPHPRFGRGRSHKLSLLVSSS